MKINQIQGIVNSLLGLSAWRNPLALIKARKKLKINLLSGKMKYGGEDDLSALYKEKREWFLKRIKDLNGNLEDFNEAKISISGNKEKIRIKYKGKVFKTETLWEFGIKKNA